LPSFTVNTTDPERDMALMGVGVNATFRNWITVFSDYDAQAGQEHYIEQNVKGGLRVSF
jgi:outer membrane autotransporter protein